MATIEATLRVGPSRELRAVNTVEMDKISKLKPGDDVRVKIATGKRSVSSNALSHQWYKDASIQTQDTIIDVRSFCKLHYGVPIMRADSEDFREVYDRSIRDALTYGQKLLAMEILNVTSLMSRDQMNRYLNTMQQEYSNRGVILETPKDAEFAKWVAAQAR